MKENAKLDRLMRYIEGEMTTSEKSNFESDLEKDQELIQFYKDWKATEETTDWLQYEALKGQMESIAVEQTKVISFWRKPLAIAASILVLIISSVLIYAQINYSNDAMAQAYYETPNFANLRDPGVNTDAAKLAFLNGDYAIAISTLESQSSLSGFNQYLLGHAYFKNGEFTKAQSSFNLLVQSQDERYLEVAQWFNALSYLKAGKENESKKIFQVIASDDQHAYSDQARSLLNELKSFFRNITF